MHTAEDRGTSSGVNRRRFHIAFIYGLWSIIAAVLGVPAALYLLLPPRVKKGPNWVDLGDVSKLTPGLPIEMVFRQNRVDGWKIQSEKSTAWVVKMPDSQIVAFGPQCTHLGCAYHWDESRTEFLCPCHTSIFGIDGSVISGPAPRPLDRYETKVASGKLMLGELHES